MLILRELDPKELRYISTSYLTVRQKGYFKISSIAIPWVCQHVFINNILGINPPQALHKKDNKTVIPSLYLDIKNDKKCCYENNKRPHQRIGET